MRNYYRIILGSGNIYAEQMYDEGYVGVSFLPAIDLKGRLHENWRDFNKEFIPIYLEKFPEKSRVAAGLACGSIWTVSKGLQIGDIVLSPDGEGAYYIGEVEGDYEYHKDTVLPHRRKVKWYEKKIQRKEMSESLQNSTGSIGTVCNISGYSEEIDNLLEGNNQRVVRVLDETVEDASSFVLEKHLEDFLVENWDKTALGKNYNIYEEEGELVGQQFPTDTGPIDILAISKDKKVLLVVELKKGRISDVVVGQLQRYMGYVKDELAEKDQTVKGVIITLEDDIRLRRALSVTNNIEFYRYEIDFKLKN
ncbi:MAG: endonuclease NucS domain-containing protein [Candidatus Dojkabacteria bacterium]